MHWHSPFFYMKPKFEALEKKLTSIKLKVSEEQLGILLDNQKNEEVLEELKLEPADQKRRRYKSDCLRHVTKWRATGWGGGKAEM